MPEKFKLGSSKIENQEGKIKKLSELINKESTINDLINLQNENFKIEPEDLYLVLDIGNKYREDINDVYPEKELISSYLISRLNKDEIEREDLEYLKLHRESLSRYLKLLEKSEDYKVDLCHNIKNPLSIVKIDRNSEDVDKFFGDLLKKTSEERREKNRSREENFELIHVFNHGRAQTFYLFHKIKEYYFSNKDNYQRHLKNRGIEEKESNKNETK